MIALFWFTARQVLVQRKILLAVALLLFPAAMAVLVRNLAGERTAREIWMMYHVLMQFTMFSLLMPLVCMLYGTSLIGAEVEQRTLIYLTTRRLRRITVLLVRFAATWVVLSALFGLGVLALHGGMITGQDLSGGNADWWQPANDLSCYLALAPAAAAGFLAVFTTLSLVFGRPLLISAIYLLVFELMLGNMPLSIRRLSISHPLRQTMVNKMPRIERLYDFPKDMEELIYPAGANGTLTLMITVAALLAVASVLIRTRELVPSKVSRD